MSVLDLTSFVGLGNFDELDLSPELVYYLSLLVEHLLYLDDSLFEADFHDNKLVLRRILQQLKHLLHLLRVSFLVPKYGLLNNVTGALFQQEVRLLLC